MAVTNLQSLIDTITNFTGGGLPSSISQLPVEGTHLSKKSTTQVLQADAHTLHTGSCGRYST